MVSGNVLYRKRFMKFTLSNKSYKVPSNWSEVKFKDFAQSRTPGLPLQKKLSYHTTIPESELSNLPYTDILKLIWAVQFQDDLPEMYEPFNSEIEVGNEAYIKMEQSRQAFEKQENKWLAAIEITKIYTGVDISDKSVLQGFGYAVFFLNRLKDSLQGTKG